MKYPTYGVHSDKDGSPCKQNTHAQQTRKLTILSQYKVYIVHPFPSRGQGPAAFGFAVFFSRDRHRWIEKTLDSHHVALDDACCGHRQKNENKSLKKAWSATAPFENSTTREIWPLLGTEMVYIEDIIFLSLFLNISYTHHLIISVTKGDYEAEKRMPYVERRNSNG